MADDRDEQDEFDAEDDFDEGPRKYADVPLLRKSSTNTVFILVNMLTLGYVPLIVVVCITLVTGNVYYNERKKNGELKVWSLANKVVAVILLVINVAYIAPIIIALNEARPNPVR